MAEKFIYRHLQDKGHYFLPPDKENGDYLCIAFRHSLALPQPICLETSLYINGINISRSDMIVSYQHYPDSCTRFFHITEVKISLRTAFRREDNIEVEVWSYASNGIQRAKHILDRSENA